MPWHSPRVRHPRLLLGRLHEANQERTPSLEHCPIQEAPTQGRRLVRVGISPVHPNPTPNQRRRLARKFPQLHQRVQREKPHPQARTPNRPRTQIRLGELPRPNKGHPLPPEPLREPLPNRNEQIPPRHEARSDRPGKQFALLRVHHHGGARIPDAAHLRWVLARLRLLGERGLAGHLPARVVSQNRTRSAAAQRVRRELPLAGVPNKDAFDGRFAVPVWASEWHAI
uniref:(northern house mosquito) hypothetical protein n=1 Tax=Culex pipiens TaxID=7175 RepID=A0A8D8BAA0_CULPI